MDQFKYEISVVVPVFNEYENLRPLTDRIQEVMKDKEYKYEIIYVDDGSTDGSSRLMDELAKECAILKVFHFSQNNGQSAAFYAGFKEAQGKFIATMDADLQVDPADLFLLIPFINKYDMVVGLRSKREDNIVKKISSQVANGVRNWLTNENIQDTGCPLKLLRSEVVESIYPFKGMHRFLPTLARMDGFKVKEVPISHFPRKFGQSKYGINNRLWRGLLDTLVIRWMQKRKIYYNFEDDQ